MPDSKITALTSISTSTDPANDPLVIVDLSDTSMAATGTTKKVTLNQLLATSPTATLASATITGDLTVATDALKVNSSTKDICIGTTTPTFNNKLTVVGGAGGDAFITSGNGTRTGYIGTDGTNVIMGAYSNHPLRIHVNDYPQMEVAALGVFNWYDGAGGTRMTLNSTGLGVGMSPSASLSVLKSSATQATGLILRNANGTDGSSISLDFETSAGTSGSETSLAGRISGRRTGSGTTGALDFFVNNLGTLGSAKMTLDASGNLGIGVAANPNTRVQVKGSSSGADYCVYSQNSSSTFLFGVRNDGLFVVPSDATLTQAPYNLTTGSAANLTIDSSGILYRSTSSLKYKSDIADSTRGLADVLKLRPVTYKAKNSGDTVFGGLIAEEVDAAGLTEFVQYAPDNTPDAIHYGNMVSLLVAAIKELAARVQTLETR